jgi:[amino group carrier protein]-lysine/ornithine hydrolase
VSEVEIARLRQMVEIYSPSGSEDAIGQFLVDEMQRLGFHAFRDEAGNAIGELGTGRRTIVLLGHMDTVPGQIAVREVDGVLYGRGAVDAKGPLATFISAAARSGPPADARLVIVGAVEEEARSTGARAIRERYRPDFTVIGEPSGWEHITLGYKGSMYLTYSLVGENAHTAGAGVSAPETAVAFWNALVQWAAGFNHDKERLFDMATPSLVSIHSANDGLSDTVRMGVNVRWPLGLDADEFVRTLREMAGDAQITIDSFEEPYRGEKNTPLTSAFLRSIRQHGGQPRFKVKTGTSDMNVVGPAWNCPILAYGPGDSQLDHTPNEHIVLEEYLKAIEVLAGVLETL